MLTDTVLKSKVDALWDRFWFGGIANPIAAIESRVTFGATRTARFVDSALIVRAANVLHLTKQENAD